MSDQPVHEVASRRRKKGLTLLIIAAVTVPVGFWLADAVQLARWAAQRASDK